MKSLNAKRIAALAGSLAMGVAFAAGSAGVSFGTIPIINGQGQPVVQIVVGSGTAPGTVQPAPSDGVVAANIAAVIGNLAYASTPITATVNGKGALTCTATGASCSLQNRTVTLSVRGLSAPTGSFAIKALIGSVLNAGAINYNTVQFSKNLQGAGAYTYAEGTSPFAITSSPNPTSAFAGTTPSLSVPTSVSASLNGGGVKFTSFQVSGNDNILQLTNTQIPALLAGGSNSGSYQESESLWLTGFPVYNQESNVSSFQVLDANGAYLVVFNKPIPLYTSHSNYVASPKVLNHASFTLLGKNWTIFNATLPATTAPTSSQFVVGGNLTLAEASTPLTTLFVGENLSASPLTVVLQDLTYQQTSNNVYDAVIGVYKNGVRTNLTQIAPGQSVQVNASGTTAWIYVSETIPGFTTTNRIAKVQVFSNLFNVSNGQTFGTANPNWLAGVRWTTNQSSVSGNLNSVKNAQNAQVQGIVIYTNLTQGHAWSPGATLNFVQSPVAYNLTFAGDALGTPSSSNGGSYDALTLTTSGLGPSGSQYVTYANPGGSASTLVGIGTFNHGLVASSSGSVAVNDTSIKEPVQLFQVASTVTGAFRIVPPSATPAPSGSVSTIDYNLDGLQFIPMNQLNQPGAANILSNTVISGNEGLAVSLRPIPFGPDTLNGNYVNNNNPLTVTITGNKYTSATSNTAVPFSTTVTFNAMTDFAMNNLQNTTIGGAAKNITNITVSYALPEPGFGVNVYEVANILSYGTPTTAKAVELGQVGAGYKFPLSGPTVLYKVTQYPNYWIAPNAVKTMVNYTVENVPFTLSVAGVQLTMPANTQARATYAQLTIPEIDVPTHTTADSNIIVGVTNMSSINTASGVTNYWINDTGGNSGDLQYQSSQASSGVPGVGIIKAGQGFRTERGSDISTISTTRDTLYIAKSIDTLDFLVGPSTGAALSTTQKIGPLSVGQSYQNITIENITASCSVVATGTGCSITGLSNLTATPSATQAITSVSLNTATTPLAVLDTQASNTQTLIVIGSKYVNSVAAQIFAQNPSLNSTFGPSSAPIVQAYGSNRILVAGYSAAQTVQAGNTFIQDLLSAASAP